MSGTQWWADTFQLNPDPSKVKVLLSSGIGAAPASRGSNVPVGGRDGEDWVEKPLGPASFTLNVRVAGATSGECWDTYHRIVAAAKRRHRLTTWKHVLPDGRAFEADGECSVVVQPKFAPASVCVFGLEIVVPAGVWRESVAAHTSTVPLAGPFPMTIDLSDFAGATAPMGALRFELDGQIDNPHVYDAETGRGWSYAATVPDLDTLVVDSGADDVTLPAGGSLDAFTYDGARFLNVMPDPDPAVAPRIVVDCTAAGANAELRVVGVRTYLIG